MLEYRTERVALHADVIQGFDEFMNLVIDDAVEVTMPKKDGTGEERRKVGQILLKGDNISLIQQIQ
jgi:small nuclear ribonucleoprotein E